MKHPLEGVKVLDFTWALSGPFGTMILADLGAEVIKIERRAVGNVQRGNGPFVGGFSTYYFSINRGKKSITLDLKTEKARNIVLDLVKQVDVVTENMTPGAMDKLGLGYEALRKVNPGIIYAAVSGFGQTGPYAQRSAVDIIVQAYSGMMSITGSPGGPPLRAGVSIGDIAGGMFMAIGVLAALHERANSGEGQMIDVSMLDCQLALMENAYIRYLNTGEIPGPTGTRHPLITPFQAFPTKDDWIVVAMGGAANAWDLFCSAIDRVDLMEDERFATGAARTQHVDELEPIISEALRKKTSAEWLSELGALGLLCAPINRIDQAAVDPQIVHRQMIAQVAVEGIGGMRLVNTPVKMSRTVCNVEKRAPNLGEHTQEVLSSLLGLSEDQISTLRDEEII